MSIKITAQFDNRLLAVNGADRYLLFKVTGEGGYKPQRVPLNLSLILDRSGSMADENKLALVKQAACFVVERLTDQDRVNVVAYDDAVRVVAKSQRANSANRRVIVGDIQKLTTGGSTNLSEGWLTGCREVAEFQTESRFIDCAWLLTDGLANAGIISQEELTTHATELRKRDISTTTFGVGLGFNEDLLRAMAEKGGGNFYFIDSGKQIKNYFEGELGERLNTVARGLALQIQSPPHLKLESLNDYETQQLGGRIIFHLGDLYAGEEKLVLVKVTAPAGQPGTQIILDSLLMLTDAQSGQGQEISVGDGTTLTYTNSQESAAQPIDSELQELIGKLLAARARQEILAANRRGDYATAQAGAAAYQQATQSAGVFSAPGVQAEMQDMTNLARQAAAPLPPGVAKEAFYNSHLAQRNRKDYKKKEQE